MGKLVRYSLILFFFFNSISLFSQESVLHAKYWYYRDRFKKYFVKIGDCQGCSIPSDRRNDVLIDWGQSTTMLGEYIGVLATEYLLLKNHGDNESAAETQQELYYALKAAIRKDKIEGYYPPFSGCNLQNTFDGFFIRDDVPIDFPIDELNTGLDANNLPYGIPVIGNTVKSGYSEALDNFYGNPVWDGDDNSDIPNIASKDEIIGLLMGCALVVRCLPSSSYEYYMAQEITNKLKSLYDNNNYKYPLPCSSYYGYNYYNYGNMNIYKFGFKAAVYVINGNSMPNHPWSAVGSMGNWLLWNNVIQPNIIGADNRRMEATLGAISDSWRIGIGVLWASIYINSTSNAILNKTDEDNWTPYYMFLWKFLHNKSKNMQPAISQAYSQLSSAPCKGPYFYMDGTNKIGVSGWMSTGRYWNNIYKQDGFESGDFNGTDYMLMYNLYSLVTNQPVYSNLNERKINNKYYPFNQSHSYTHLEPLFYIHIGGVWIPFGIHPVTDYTYTIEADDAKPYIFKAFNTIETNAVIDTKVHSSNYSANTNGTNRNGHVTMVAGKQIHLKPGFRVKKGAYFHGYIHKFDPCNDVVRSFLDSIIENNSDYFNPVVYDDNDPMPGYLPLNYPNTLLTDSLNKINSDSLQDGNFGNAFDIVPNPNNGNFTISSNNLTNDDEYEISIFNETGVEVYRKDVWQFPVNIALNQLASGLYVVKITSEQSVYNLKFFKQ